jgi:hypothetical protein
MVLKEAREWVFKVLEERQDQEVEILGKQVFRVLKGLRDKLALRECKVSRVLKAYKDELVLRECKAFRDKLVSKVFRDYRVSRDKLVCEDQLVPKVQLALESKG